MKKYNKPTIKVMEVEMQTTLLDNSLNATPTSLSKHAPEYGGESDGTPTVGAKSYSLWDDEEE